jgi:hypothetical protein
VGKESHRRNVPEWLPDHKEELFFLPIKGSLQQQSGAKLTERYQKFISAKLIHIKGYYFLYPGKM